MCRVSYSCEKIAARPRVHSVKERRRHPRIGDRWTPRRIQRDIHPLPIRDQLTGRLDDEIPGRLLPTDASLFSSSLSSMHSMGNSVASSNVALPDIVHHALTHEERDVAAATEKKVRPSGCGRNADARLISVQLSELTIVLRDLRGHELFGPAEACNPSRTRRGCATYSRALPRKADAGTASFRAALPPHNHLHHILATPISTSRFTARARNSQGSGAAPARETAR